MKVFLTGGTGFIGSYVAAELLAQGHELVALARNPEKHPTLGADARVTRVSGTIHDTDRIRAALEGVDACVHVALGWGDTPVDMLVLHYTGMPSAKDALSRLCDASAKVSAHYLIEENGRVHRLVAESRRAWHAGVAYWRGHRDINARFAAAVLDVGAQAQAQT